MLFCSLKKCDGFKAPLFLYYILLNMAFILIFSVDIIRELAEKFL